MKSNLLSNKTAVIFGAGGNLGKQVAYAFAEQGAKLFVSDIHPETISGIGEVKRVNAKVIWSPVGLANRALSFLIFRQPRPMKAYCSHLGSGWPERT